MYKTNEAIIASLQLLDANGQAASGKTVTATAYDEAYGVFSNPGVSEIGSTGIYYCTFTPDAEGLWTLLFTCADPLCIRAYSWYVQKQVADDIDTLLSRLSAGRAGYLDNLSAGAVALEATLATHDTDIKALLATIAGYIDTEIGAIETKLDTPANFMADVSALALEATLSTHDGDIKTLLAALNDLADSEVWGYATRTLTSHAFPFTNPGAALDVSNIRTAAYGQYNTEMARITANVATEAKQDIIDTVVDGIKTETDQLPNWRFEDKLPTTPTVDAEASAAEQSLTAGSVTPTFPTGATRQRAFVVATLHAANKSAATHKIGLTLQIQKDGGGYGDVVDLTANPPISMLNVDGATATFAIVCDVTGTVDTSAVQYDFKWLVDSDNAGAVNYTSNFVLVIIYSM